MLSSWQLLARAQFSRSTWNHRRIVVNRLGYLLNINFIRFIELLVLKNNRNFWKRNFQKHFQQLSNCYWRVKKIFPTNRRCILKTIFSAIRIVITRMIWTWTSLVVATFTELTQQHWIRKKFSNSTVTC